MHAPAAFQLSVSHYGVWRGALGLMALLVLATAAVWAGAGALAGPGWVGLLGLTALLPLWRLGRCGAVSLRWDTQCWHLGPLATRGQEPWSGRMQVALDLGDWMLLRLQPAGPTPFRRSGHWLPVQRRGHEQVWHTLRCTLYCAHSDAGRAAAAH